MPFSDRPGAEHGDEPTGLDRLPHLVRVVGRRFDLRRPGLEHPLLAKDLRIELLERAARLDPELVDEQPPAFVEGLQRVRLPAGPVERQHQLGPESLTQRVRTEERLEHRDDLVVPLELELGVHQLFGRGEAQLLEPARLVLSERLELRIGQRRPAPQGECLVEEPARSTGSAVRAVWVSRSNRPRSSCSGSSART